MLLALEKPFAGHSLDVCPDGEYQICIVLYFPLLGSNEQAGSKRAGPLRLAGRATEGQLEAGVTKYASGNQNQGICIASTLRTKSFI